MGSLSIWHWIIGIGAVLGIIWLSKRDRPSDHQQPSTTETKSPSFFQRLGSDLALGVAAYKAGMSAPSEPSVASITPISTGGKMKISINRSEKTSGVFKKSIHYVVEIGVAFSEEELAIIKKKKLGETIVFSRNIILPYSGPQEAHTTIKDLMKGPFPHAFDSLIEADKFDNSLRQNYLPTLKSYISKHATSAPSSDTFEL